ncbi:MAG: hypothetical protein P8M87_07560 [Crocinitomicaceae bacterium]|nr:hypothetical protein [Crocinitomicaceae bacterium]MDG2505995.1 hypothetical protein [Crocinitomicaceae bacterium]
MKTSDLFFLSIFYIIFGCRKVNNTCTVADYPDAPGSNGYNFYGGSGEEAHGHFILTCSDGGYLQVGETGFIPNSAKVLVVKIDQGGALQWSKEFSSGSGHNLGNSAFEADDGYFICGSLNENSAIIKLNKLDGSVVFEKTHDNGGSDAFEHMSVTPEGIIAVGYVQAEDNLNTFFTEGQGYLTILDGNGNKLSGINLENTIAHAYRIKKLGSDFMVSGLTEGANDYALLKIDASGNIIWNKTFGGANLDHCFAMDLSTEGDIFLSGHTLTGTENWDAYTMKIDMDGNQLWESKTGNPRGFDPKYIHDEVWGIKATSDGGCIIVAGTGDEYSTYKRRCGNDGDDSNTWHVYLVKYDGNGNVQWQKTYGDAEGSDWAGEDIDLTADGGAIVAVDNGSFGFLKISPF